MKRKELQDVTEAVRKNYEYACGVFAKGDSDYAILLLRNILKQEIGFVEARALLRKAEQSKLLGVGSVAKVINDIKVGLKVFSGKSKLSKEPYSVIDIAEDALVLNVKNFSALKLLSDAAKNVGYYCVAIETMELARDFYPADVDILKELVSLYKLDNDGEKAYELQSAVVAFNPDDLQAQAELRTTAALASLEKKRNKTKEMAELSREVTSISFTNLGDKVIRSEVDVSNAISEYEQSVAGGSESVDVRRELGRLYQLSNQHDKAIAAYEWVVEKMGALDPEIDKCIEKSHEFKFDAEIADLRESGGSEEAISEFESRRQMYKLDLAKKRVDSYPNDTQLRYDLACLYWNEGSVDEALAQFQIARKNPQRRLSSSVYIGMCFAAKSQFDMAIEQIEAAVSEMHSPNKEKLNALYQLADAYDMVGNSTRALECYKKIYQADVTFLDVEQKIQKHY